MKAPLLRRAAPSKDSTVSHQLGQSWRKFNPRMADNNERLVMTAYPSALFAWALLWLPALLLKAGLGPALRGAFVGAGPWVQMAEHAGNFFSQVTAVSTSTLLLALGLSSLRIEAQLLLRLGVACCAALPTAILFLAQRAILPHFATGVAALLSGSALLLGASATHMPRRARWALMLCGAAVMARSFTEFSWWAPWASTLSAPASALGATLCTAALVLALMHLHQSALSSAVILGAGLLLGIASQNASQLDCVPTFLLAQTLHGMADGDSMGPMLVQFCTALVALAVHFGTFRTSPMHFALLLVLLTALSPLTPLSSSALALAGIFVLVVDGSNARPAR